LKEKNVKLLKVTPTEGFGNKLNGVLQGVLSAHMLDRCLMIDWIYSDVLSTSLSSSDFPQLTKPEKIPAKKLRSKKSLIFPSTAAKVNIQNYMRRKTRTEQVIEMKVGYRDKFCTYVSSSMDPFDLPEKYWKYLKKRKMLCTFLEGCILRNYIQPNNLLQTNINSFVKTWLKPDSISVALHVRMGDYVNIGEMGLEGKKDVRVPLSALDTFWHAALWKSKKLMRTTKKLHASFFLATDGQIALDSAKKAFKGQNFFHTIGKFQHSALKQPSDELESTYKMLTDWFLISKADIIIQGPWSSYVEKALVYSTLDQEILRCHAMDESIAVRTDFQVPNMTWGCTQNILQDTYKGPRAVEIRTLHQNFRSN